MPTPGTSYAIRNTIFFAGQAAQQNIRLQGVEPEVTWEETDQTDPAGRFRIVVAGDEYRIQRSLTADFGSFTDLLRIGATGFNIVVGEGNVPAGTEAVLTVTPRLTVSVALNADRATGFEIRAGTSDLDGVTPDSISAMVINAMTLSSDAGARTLAAAASLRIAAIPIAGNDMTLTAIYGLWIDAGTSRFDGDILVDGANQIRANTSVEIGVQVTNESLTIGSLGTVRLPVKTDTGEADDAAMGNLPGCILYNSLDNVLEVRDTTADNPRTVGVNGYVIQRRARTTPGGTYHPAQLSEGDAVDETRCIVCGETMQPGDQVTMWGNASFRKGDLHAIFGHLHLEENPEFVALKLEVAALAEQIKVLQERP